MGVNLFLDNFPVMSVNSIRKNVKNGMILTLANGEVPSNEELWIIGEIWRIGRGTNFTVLSTNNGTNVPVNFLQIQVKSNSGKVRLKIGREVEEFSLEEFLLKLEANELNSNEQINILSDAQEFPEIDHEDFNESNVPIHYVLSNPRTNPILREKAMKAMKQVTTATTKSIEIIIHELPRDMIGKLVYDPATLKNTKMGEEQREQLQRINQFITKKSKVMMVLYNHKDNQTDLYYIK